MIVSLIPLLAMLPKRHLLQLGIISQAIHLSKLCNYYLHFFVDFPCIFTPCNSCQINKSHKLPFNISTLTSNAPLDLNFSHVWTSPILSYDNFKYYIIFVDSYTKYISLYPIKQKSDSFQKQRARYHGMIIYLNHAKYLQSDYRIPMQHRIQT